MRMCALLPPTSRCRRMKAEHKALVASGVDPTVAATELLPLFKCKSAAEADAVVASVRAHFGVPVHSDSTPAQAAAAAPVSAPVAAAAAPPLHPVPAAEPSGPFPLDIKSGLTLARVHEVLGLCEAAEEFGTLVCVVLRNSEPVLLTCAYVRPVCIVLCKQFACMLRVYDV